MFFSEKKLVEAAKKSPDDFEKLYEKYVDRIYSFVASRTKTKQEAEDLTSEIWLIILNKINSFSPEHENSFRGWIFVITRNKLKDYYRKSERASLELFDSWSDKKDSYSEKVNLNIDNQIDSKILRAVLEKLPEKQLECMKLKYFGELRNKEIAVLLKVSEKTVSANLSRAIHKIKQRLLYMQ
jgi:RNA polymerase sigma-70 factor (ECF subfamily)